MNETQLLSAETQEIADSTSFSAISLAGFLLSLAGLLSVQYIQVVPVAIVSGALGAFGLLIARRNNLSFLSRVLATLAVIIGVTSTTVGLSARSLYNQYDLVQAEKICREYLEALSRGDLANANYLVGFQLDPTDATGEYGNMESKTQRAKKRLLSDPAHVEIRERRSPAKWVFVGLQGEYPGSKGYTYKLLFRDEGQTNPPTYWIYAQKNTEKYSKENKVHWYVDNLEVAKKL